jgi:hypothetical protein
MDLDEWRSAARDLTEIDRNNTGIEVRTSVGLNAFDEGREQ